MKNFRTPILTICTVLMITILSSCAINKNYQAKVGLHYTGTYTIKTIQGNTVQFKEVAGTYKVDSDTLKVNDKITINVVRTGAAGRNELTKN